MAIDVGKDSDQTTLHLSQVMKNHSQTTIADKLHRHFAHALANILIRLIKTVGSPWTNDPDLKGQLKSAMRNCQTCKLFKMLPTKPVVGLPLATHFQETAATEFQFYRGKIILHMIDHAT